MADWALEAAKILGGAGGGYLVRDLIERYRSRRPVDFHVDDDIARIYGNVPNWVSFPYYFDCRPEHLPINPPAHGLDWSAWAVENHGCPALHSEIQVVISTRTERTVLVNNLRVSAATKPAPGGTIAILPVGGASITHKQISVELDGFAPRITFRETGGMEAGDGFAFALKKDEVAKFSITVRAVEKEFFYEWHGLLDVIVGRKLRTIAINNMGKPFELHGGQGVSQSQWNGHQWTHFPPKTA